MRERNSNNNTASNDKPNGREGRTAKYRGDDHSRKKRGNDETADRLNLVEQLLERVVRRLKEQNDEKATLTDFVRLLELKRELESDQPRSIEVTWVESGEPKQD
jgi:hypothetical protein